MRVGVTSYTMSMARPPLGPMAMDHVIKFRLRSDELSMLEEIADGSNLSATLRDIIHKEHRRKKGKK